jgi:hypothetical protein
MRAGVVVIGILSAGLLIGGTVWYFRSKRPKKSDADDKSSEDIPDTMPKSSTSPNVQQQPAPTNTTVSGGGSTSTTVATNFINEVKAKLGAGTRVKDNQVFAPFNSNKNIAVFYSNGRFAIFKIGEEKKGALLKGSYSNGGLTLTPDKGKVITSSSVWTNLNRLPFKK